MNKNRTPMKNIYFALLLALVLAADVDADSRPNFLIITADDMNWDSVGCYGCQLADATPAIDRLADQGIRFQHAHVAAAACYPSRSAISTGRRGHRSGGEGFFHLRFPDVPTVQQLLHDNGYRVGILGKVEHSTPYKDTPWDVAKEMHRDTDQFEHETATFIDESRAAKQPFYLIVNSHDPHRPYYKLIRDGKTPGEEPSKVFQPAEVPIHPTLPDHPDVRLELAEYFSSVRRCDDVVGRLVRLLEKRKLTSNTMIVFLSDHGMAMPSAKSNCYVQSTRTPFIIRWDGQVKPRQVDNKHFISSMDLLPTILETAGIKNPGGMDGRSLLPLMKGQEQAGRERIFTQYYMKIGQTNYQMRAVQNQSSLFVFNPWYNGKPVYNTSSMGGECFKTILKVAQSDPHWKVRADYLLTRAPVEFFDLRSDPHCLNNRIQDPGYAEQIELFQQLLTEHLKQSDDPMAEVFTTWQETKSVPRMVETYGAMWEKHGIPGRVAKNPVDMSRWSDAPKKKEPKKSQPTDDERKAKRAARRAAAKENEQS